jgi:hypothetical protein
MSHAELGIYIHGRNDQRRAILEKRAATILPKHIFEPKAFWTPPTHTPSKAVIHSGDGILRSYLESWNNSGDVPVVGISAGGTGNVLHKVLAREGLSMTFEEFVDKEAFSFQASFNPGLAGDRMFTNVVSFNQYDNPNRRANEALRKISFIGGKTRIRIAYFYGLISTIAQLKNDKPVLEMYIASPYFGYVKLFDDQRTLGAADLTRVSIEPCNKLNMVVALIRTMVAFNQSKPPKDGVLRFEKAESFVVNNQSGNLTLDGDLYKTEMQETTIKRSDRKLALVALT